MKKALSTTFPLLAIASVVFILFHSCNKQPITAANNNTPASQNSLIIPADFFIDAPVPGVAVNRAKNNNTNNAASNSPDPDNGDEPVILGAKLNNPYTIANMQQAYQILYGIPKIFAPTNLYVRFKPANTEQIETLEDNQDLELQDYPMDYQVLQDGDYYQDPNLGTEDIPWLYSVVPVGYIPPAGIQYEVIAPIYIPANDFLLEEMAESIAAGAIYNASLINNNNNNNTVATNNNARKITRIDIPSLPFIFPPLIPTCDEPGDCGGGGGSPQQPPDPKIPRGNITVQDFITCDTANTPIKNVALRQARVVCKRWFKIATTYTNDQGDFMSAKKFRHKVKIIVKTKNTYAKIAKLRGARLWQILFPVRKRIGIFDQGAMANVIYVFTKPNPTSAHDKALPYWVAATTHNSVVEFREYAQEFGIGQPPNKLRILVTNWGMFAGTGAAPMFNKCHGDMTAPYATLFLAGSPLAATIIGGLTAITTVLKNKIDIILGYQTLYDDYNCSLTSPWLKELAYHEIGHAAHYNQVGSDFWIDYRKAIENEYSKFDQSDYSPYGNGSDANNAPIIATGEMWGNHCEYIFANRRYGNGGSLNSGLKAQIQGQQPYPNIVGLNCYLNAIENFNPNYASDKWKWIPMGLPYDLMDNRNDNAFVNGVVIDNVSGYTNQQIFNALQNDVRSIPAFKNRLLQQNGNNQLIQVNALFNQYGY